MPNPPCPSTRPTEKLPASRRVPGLRAWKWPGLAVVVPSVGASGAPQVGQVRASAGMGLAQIGQSGVLTGPPRAAATADAAGCATRDLMRHGEGRASGGKATRAALRATSVPAGVGRSGEAAVGCSSLSTGASAPAPGPGAEDGESSMASAAPGGLRGVKSYLQPFAPRATRAT